MKWILIFICLAFGNLLASEDLIIEKQVRGSSEVSKYLVRSFKLKKLEKIKGRTTEDQLLAMALSGETIERVAIAYNKNNECKIIFRSKSLVFEYEFPRKSKCMDLYRDVY